MDSSNDSDQQDLWSDEFPPNTSRRSSNHQYSYNPFNPQTAASQPSSTLQRPPHHEYNQIPGFQNAPSSMEDYQIRFGTHSLNPSSPPNRVALEFEDIVNLHALEPSEPHLRPPSVTPTPGQYVTHQSSGSVPLQIPTLPHFNQGFLTDQPLLASVSYNIHRNPGFLDSDYLGARSGSYSGPSQGHYHPSVSSSASRPTLNTGFSHPFHLESQRASQGYSRTVSPPFGPTQHSSRFDTTNHGHQPSADPSTIQASSVPLPMSPSEDSSSSTVSPAMSTSSLSNLPSSSTTGGEMHRWRLNFDTPGWACDCGTNVKKKKRHLESCPRNPEKPTIQCPCCTTVFSGGSRRSALRKHMRRFHEDQMDLLNRERED